jgi:hypothetical protein
LLGARRQKNRGSLIRKQLRHRAANPAPRSGNQRNLILKEQKTPFLLRFLAD